MNRRRLSGVRWVSGALLWAGLTTSPVQAFYDPFEEGPGVKASDELEERLWAETALLRPTLIQGQRSAAIEALQDAVRQHFVREFGELATPIRVHVYEEPELTVATTPGGEIYLATGLLLRVRSDEELSALLARELAHIVNRDAARTLSYTKLGSNLKEVFSTTFAVYNVATGLISVNSVLNSFAGFSPEGILGSLQLTPEKLLEGGGKMFADYLKGSLEDTLKESAQTTGKNLAGFAVHRLSVQAVTALIKTSVFGYSERMEKQADEFALRYLQARYGNTDAYQSLMQRLLDQSNVRAYSYLTFYASKPRMLERLKSLADFKVEGEMQQLAKRDMALRMGLAAAGGGIPGNLARDSVLEMLNAPTQPAAVDTREAAADTILVVPAALVPALESSAESLTEPAMTQPTHAPVGEPLAPPPETPVQSTVMDEGEDTPPAVDVPAEAQVDKLTGGASAPDANVAAEPTSQPYSPFMLALAKALPELIRREARDSEPARFLHLTGQSLPAPLAWPDDLELTQTDVLLKRGEPGDQEKAAALLAHRVLTHPDDWRSAKLAAQVYFRLKDYDTSLAFYEKALANVTEERERTFLTQARDRVERRLNPPGPAGKR